MIPGGGRALASIEDDAKSMKDGEKDGSTGMWVNRYEDRCCDAALRHGAGSERIS